MASAVVPRRCLTFFSPEGFVFRDGRGQLDCAIGVDGDIFLIFDVVHAPPFFVPWQSCVICFVGLRLVLFFFDQFLSFPDRQEWETGEYFEPFFVTGLYVIDGCCLFYFIGWGNS